MSGSSRVFIGISLPSEAQKVIQRAMRHYDNQLTRKVPEENWHVTMAFLGEIDNFQQHIPALTASLSQAFVPAISLTHLSEGKKSGQLWAYVNITNQLRILHAEVLKRVESTGINVPDNVKTRPFVPHVRVGDVERGKFGILDTPAVITFRFAELQIFQSHQTEDGVHYSVEGAIALT